MTEWFEDESFWESFYPVLFPEEKLQTSEDEVEKILNLTSFWGRDVLDLCCGPGRHSVILAKKGVQGHRRRQIAIPARQGQSARGAGASTG